MKDIEEIVISNLDNFVKGICNTNIINEKHYQKLYNEMKVKYKICPSKPQLRSMYNKLLVEKEIIPNQSFLNHTLKRKCRSTSGVSVITVFTSPTPTYINYKGEKVQQKFSCKENCSYCPNEPEIRIILEVLDIDLNKNSIRVFTYDDITLVKLLSYVVKDEEKYDVEDCICFKDDYFTIIFKDDIDNFTFIKEEILIGVKVEQPRSYLTMEPGVRRATRNNFDPQLQIYDRADALQSCGHEVDKIEILVLGGTWDHYNFEYRKYFITSLYHGINTLNNRNVNMLSLEEEIAIAEKSKKRLIGLTVETRPDCINLKQIKKLREFNVTRLQIGVQHIDNDVLEYIERGCKTEDTIKGNNLWKQNGGKIDWHLMPDLPGSNFEKDLEMFQKIFGVNSIKEISKNYFVYDLKHPELQADQLKIYPCEVVPWTKIKEWYENGSYKPYAEDEEKLIELIVYIKENVFPWIRINRIVRDIPNTYILGGNENVNLHQKVINTTNIKSMDIRSREVKTNVKNIDKAELFIRVYNGIESTEYFISYESPDQEILYGFLRLRINHNNDNLVYPILRNSSHIRELHVYGSIVKHGSSDKKVQHQGFGKKMLKVAEDITLENGYSKISVISGVGVREYYQKNGYILINNYMVKHMYRSNYDTTISELFIYMCLLIIITSAYHNFVTLIYDRMFM